MEGDKTGGRCLDAKFGADAALGRPGFVCLVTNPEEGREVLEAAEEGCGGPIEDLVPTDGRDLGATSVLTGDCVEDLVVDRTARVDNCRVGDFVGDYANTESA